MVTILATVHHAPSRKYGITCKGSQFSRLSRAFHDQVSTCTTAFVPFVLKFEDISRQWNAPPQLGAQSQDGFAPRDSQSEEPSNGNLIISKHYKGVMKP